MTACARFALLAVALAGLCGPTQQSIAAGDKRLVALATASFGGTFYQLGSALTHLWNRHIPNMQATVQASRGAQENIFILLRGEAAFALVQNDTAAEAIAGKGMFDGDPQTLLRIVGFMGYTPRFVIVRAALADIDSVDDFEGLTLWGGQAKASGIHTSISQLLIAHGIDPEGDVRFEFMSNAEAIEALRSGGIDVLVSGAGGVQEALVSAGGKMIPLTEKGLQALALKFPNNVPYTAAAGSLPNFDGPYNTFALVSFLATRADVPESLVYDVTRATYDSAMELKDVLASASDITLENALVGASGFPLHPGAQKYFDEKGLPRP